MGALREHDSGLAEKALLVIAGAAAGALLCTWAAKHRAGRDLAGHGSIPRQPKAPEPSGEVTVSDGFTSDTVIREHFTRCIQFFGEAGQRKIAQSFVVVVGLGGVGSHAATMLLRSGVGRLRLIDFDQVSLSSLNRHATATREDVGLSKAACLQAHLRRIVPEAEVEAVRAMFSADTAEDLLAGCPDFVLDAIDNLNTKVLLIAACRHRSLPVLCSAGAGAKADPTRVRIGDLSDCGTDPLARLVRKVLRKQHKIENGVPVLLSVEPPRCQLQPAPDNAQDYQIIPSFRVRAIPVLGPLPAIFGSAAASFILCHLAGKPLMPDPPFRMQAKQYQTLLDRLCQREEASFGHSAGVDVDVDDVAFLMRTVYRGLSARGPRYAPTAHDWGTNRLTDHLTLTRWDRGKLASIDNLVLLTFDEAEAHEDKTLEQVQQEDPEMHAYVTRLLAAVPSA